MFVIVQKARPEMRYCDDHFDDQDLPDVFDDLCAAEWWRIRIEKTFQFDCMIVPYAG